MPLSLRNNGGAGKMGRVVTTVERDIIRYYYYFVQQTERGFAFYVANHRHMTLRRGERG